MRTYPQSFLDLVARRLLRASLVHLLLVLSRLRCLQRALLILALHHLLTSASSQALLTALWSHVLALVGADWLSQAVFNLTVATLPLILAELLVGKENA